jgi:hypothetical protein
MMSSADHRYMARSPHPRSNSHRQGTTNAAAPAPSRATTSRAEYGSPLIRPWPGTNGTTISSATAMNVTRTAMPTVRMR